MIKNYSGKIAFACAMVAVALVSRIMYPRMYSVATGNSGVATTSLPAAIPQFVLPALSLATIDPPADPTSGPANPPAPSVKGSDDQNANAGAVTGGSPAAPAVTPNASTIFVAPQGPVANSTFSHVGAGAPPALAAEAALVADLTTGARFMGQNASERWPLASVTKLMTATVVLDKMSPAQKITITQDAFNVDPSEKNLHVGDTYTTGDLLRFLLLPSSNVAAEALADAYGRTGFIAEMNARATAWGMANTHYADPSGLAVGSQSTANDLVLLAQKIYSDYPDILTITRTSPVTVTEIGSGDQVVVKSINEFAGETDFIGGKTGYTDQANGNLLSIFSYEGHPIVVVMLGTDDGTRFANTETLYNWFTANFR
jgi:D-alanyl-D-alanine carboxypeptidase (penicillin-binding protein 5/6)